MIDTAEQQIDQLLAGTVAELDITPGLYRAAVEEYGRVGRWLGKKGDEEGGAPWDVYPQGSFPLGTVVRPAREGSEYDLDLVCNRAIHKSSITQALLKADVGGGLAEYVAANQSETQLRCDEGKRCWTLRYTTSPFHMDVLPAIPDHAGSATGILITDRDLREWQHSDPKQYAAWFKSRMAPEYLRKRATLAEERRANIEDVPEWEVKTTLQRVVQVLKRHRDLHFINDPERRPTSIVITTLAARAYTGEQNLFDAVVHAAETMPGLVERDEGVLVVANPVQQAENFADKWQRNPERARDFFAWLNVLAADLRDTLQQRGLHQVVRRLSESFGPGPVTKAAERLGDLYRSERERGALSMALGTGALSSGSGTRVRNHTFYGGTKEG